jgi:hypothetical protein
MVLDSIWFQEVPSGSETAIDSVSQPIRCLLIESLLFGWSVEATRMAILLHVFPEPTGDVIQARLYAFMELVVQ